MQLHEDQFRTQQLRRCISFKDQREYEDQENDEMQRMVAQGYDSQDSEHRYNFISQPNSPRAKEMLVNNNFNIRMKEISKAFRMRDKYDNCYNEAKPLHYFQFKSCKMVSRAVQTNVLELLGVDDWQCQQAQFKYQNNLNNQLEQYSVDEENDLNDATKLITNGLFTQIIDQFEGFQDNKKRKYIPPQRIKNLPKFELTQLIGDFDIDIEGNQIFKNNGIDKNGKDILLDKQGRRVNSRGYLIDDDYNVIKENGQVVFKPDDVDSDGEVPAPFCYQKFRSNLGKDDEFKFQQKVIDEQQMEDDIIEKEFQKIKSQLINKYKQSSGMDQTDDRYESERSIKSDDFENIENHIAPSKFIREPDLQPELYNPNDEDYIAKLVRPMKPLSREEILKQFQKKGIQINKTKTKVQNEDVDIFNYNQNSNFKSINNVNNDITHQDKSRVNHERLAIQLNTDQDLDSRLNSQYLNSNSNYNSKTNIQNHNFKKIDKKHKIENTTHHILSNKKSKYNEDNSEVSIVKKVKKVAKLDALNLLLDDPKLKQKETLQIKKREEDIQEGIKKFHDMLARYPLRPKNKRNSNSLANKTLEKVYGRIKRQYANNAVNNLEQSQVAINRVNNNLFAGDSYGLNSQQSEQCLHSRNNYIINKNSSAAQNSYRSKSNVSNQLYYNGSLSQFGIYNQNSFKVNQLIKNSSEQSQQYQIRGKNNINNIFAGLMSNSSEVNKSKRIQDFSQIYGRDQLFFNKITQPVLGDKNTNNLQFPQNTKNDFIFPKKSESGKDHQSSYVDSHSISRTKFQKQFPLTQIQSNYINPARSSDSHYYIPKEDVNGIISAKQSLDEENFSRQINQDTINVDNENENLLRNELQFQNNLYQRKQFNHQQNQFIIEETVENLQMTDDDINQNNITIKNSQNNISNQKLD